MDDLEARVARLEAMEAIKALKARYWHACDTKDAALRMLHASAALPEAP